MLLSAADVLQRVLWIHKSHDPKNPWKLWKGLCCWAPSDVIPEWWKAQGWDLWREEREQPLYDSSHRDTESKGSPYGGPPAFLISKRSVHSTAGSITPLRVWAKVEGISRCQDQLDPNPDISDLK